MTDPFEIVTLTLGTRKHRTTARRLPELQSIMANRYGPATFEPGVRRVLDIGAGCGAFAHYAFFRWGNPWVDAWELEACEAPLLKENGPPGLRVLEAIPLDDWSPYDVIRIARAVPSGPRSVRAGCLMIVDHQQRIG